MTKQQKKIGRPPSDGKRAMDASLLLRVHAVQWKKWCRIAAREGYKSLSAWARDQLDKASEQ